MKSLAFKTIYLAIAWVLLCLVILSCCSPERRINRILKNNPELVDTSTKKIVKTLLVEKVVSKTDSALADSLGVLYFKALYESRLVIDSLKAIKDCERLAIKAEKKIKDVHKLKSKTDSVNKRMECYVAPISIDTMGIKVTGVYKDGKYMVYVSAKTKSINTCEQKEYWQFWQFWVAAGLVILAIYLKK